MTRKTPPSDSRATGEPGPFDTAHLHDDLKGHFVRGGAAALLSQGTIFVLRLVVTAVLARLLVPDDFGVFTMVVSVTRFFGLFKDFGLSVATVQRDEVTHAQVSNLFWVNLGFGAVLAVVSASLSPAVAAFYDRPELVPVMLVLSAGFLLGGLGAQHGALLRRQLRLRTTAWVTIVAETSAAALAIGAAALGAGYWALVVQVIASELFRTLGFWLTSPWIPGRPTRGAGVRAMLALGGHLTGAHAIGYFARNLDKYLIGRRWGGASLGTYALAHQLLTQPLQRILGPIANAAVPTLSRLQTDAARFREGYLRILPVVGYMMMPAIAVTAALAHDVVMLVLGKKWLPVGNIFQALAFFGFLQPLATVRWVVIARGQTRRLLGWALVAGPVLAVAILLGLPHGALGVAIAYATASALLRVTSVPFLLRGTPIRARDTAAALGRPAALAVVAGGAAWLIRRSLSGHALSVTLTGGLAAGFLAGAFVVFLVPGYRRDIRIFVETLRAFRRRPVPRTLDQRE